MDLEEPEGDRGERHVTLSELVASIDTDRQYGNLSSAIRPFVLDFYATGRQTTRTGGTRARRHRCPPCSDGLASRLRTPPPRL
jgi:predicted DNA-binding ribbon-helix-helix protein